MKVLFLTLNYAPEEIGIGHYSTVTAEWLAAAGHEVSVVAGKPYYPHWKVDAAYRGGVWRTSRENGVAVVRCAHYVPAQPNGFRRLVHHASFALSAFLPMVRKALSRRERPDVVMVVAPSLIAAPVAALAARLARAPLWLHVQDFEVEAAVATGLLAPGRRLTRFAERFEAAILWRARTASSIGPAMVDRLLAKGVGAERVYEFRNWARIEHIAPLEQVSPYRAEWGITAKHVALYSGNIANKQGIDIVIDAARLLRDRSDIAFVVCGNGPNRAWLESAAHDLPNVHFHDLQPQERLGDLLGLADVHLLPQIAGAADLVLPSKLTNMLASGRPVIATTDPESGLAREVDGTGVITPPGDVQAFAAAIERLCDDPELAAKFGRAARQKALETWHEGAILRAFERRLARTAGLIPDVSDTSPRYVPTI